MEPAATLSTGDLRGKVVLITGGRRVGGELALMLAARGTHVAMTFHTSRAVIERTIERTIRYTDAPSTEADSSSSRGSAAK